MSKTIWIINNSAGSVKHGMVYRNYYLARQLQEIGYKCFIISSTYNHQFFNQPNDGGVLNYEEVNGIQYCFIRSLRYSGNGIKRVLAFFNFAFNFVLNQKKIKFPKPDYIIGSSPMPLLGPLSYLTSRKYKAKFIFEIRDLWPLTLLELGGFSKFHPFILLLSWSERFSLKHASAVVSVMPYANTYLERKGMKPSLFHYIPNGISSKDLDVDLKNEITLPVPKKEGKLYLCYAGAIGTANNMKVLLQAVNKLDASNNIEIVIIGDGPEKEALVNIYKDLNHVHFVDRLPKEQILKVILGYDFCYVGALPKDIYKYGISFTKVFDYMYAGKPIIFAVDCANDIVSEANCGFSPKSDSPDEVYSAIRQCASLPFEEREKLGKSAKEYVLKHHSWEILGKQYSEMLLSLEKK